MEVLGAGPGEDWLWDQRTLIHLTSSPPLSHGLTQQSGGWEWRQDKPSLIISPPLLGKVSEEFSEVEG